MESKAFFFRGSGPYLKDFKPSQVRAKTPSALVVAASSFNHQQ